MIRPGSSALNDVDWSRDGKQIAAVSQGGFELLWHAEEVSAPMPAKRP